MDTSSSPHRSAAATNHFQVLIIGGGISGTLAATVLGRAGYHVCLMDRFAEYPKDFRAEHLDGSMVDAMVRLKILDDLTTDLFRGETVTLARNGRIIGTAGTVNFGLRYEALVNRARASLPANVHLAIGRVTNVTTGPDIQEVVLVDGRRFQGRLAVIATGPNLSVCRQLGLRRRILREAHSLTFGFDIEPIGNSTFRDSFLVYQRERIEDRVDYFAAFTLGGHTRVNLFTYRDYKESWTRDFLADPDPGLRNLLPGLESVIGRYRALGPVEARPIDLYVTENVEKDGVVLIGDALQSSCPATGMGLVRVLNDIERLSSVHVPRWLATPGMSAAKIASYHHDPVKVACDGKALHDSEYRRAVSTETSVPWRIHRARVNIMEQVQAWRHRLPTAHHPRVSPDSRQPSLAAG